jgi:predicted CoA-substrate-specific enzyme activase
MITAGIDIGSITAKVAILDENGIIGEMVDFTGYNAGKAGENIFRKLLSETGLDEGAIGKIVSTGYGRNSVEFAHKAITEITCHAAGAYYLDKSVRSIIDVGGQDSKALLIYEGGKVRDFAMNDKCAAGTGRFLEVMARALHLDLDEMAEIALNAENPAKISSICTVFAESEVVSLISKGESRENIISGINESVASRVTALARRVNVAPPVMMTGGVARNKGVVKALGEKLGTELIVSPHAQINGAIGAAILARDL